MDCIWRLRRPLFVRDVVDVLRQSQPCAYTTVMTTMDRLFRKGLLRRTSQARAWRYEAVGTRDSFAATLMRDAWATSNSSPDSFAAFLAQLADTERQALQAALAAVRLPPDGPDS